MRNLKKYMYIMHVSYIDIDACWRPFQLDLWAHLLV